MNRSRHGHLRALADWFVRSAGAVLPGGQAEWADAMVSEVSAITSDRDALRWAIGCFVSTHAAQVRVQLHRPSAFLPLLMSSVAMAMVLIHAALYGIVDSPDEGTPAHIFQLLMVAQLPLMAFFTIRWLPRAPISTIQVVLLQVGAAGCAVVSVLLLT
jgi:hypothetical protein